MPTHQVVITLGSNHRQQYDRLQQAVKQLQQYLQITAVTPPLLTSPFGCSSAFGSSRTNLTKNITNICSINDNNIVTANNLYDFISPTFNITIYYSTSFKKIKIIFFIKSLDRIRLNSHIISILRYKVMYEHNEMGPFKRLILYGKTY